LIKRNTSKLVRLRLKYKDLIILLLKLK